MSIGQSCAIQQLSVQPAAHNPAMNQITAIEVGEPPTRSECWCCGRVEAPERMVHLGAHPEVVLCLGCAHFVHRAAAEIEDQSRTGIGVRLRDRVRQARGLVMRRDWHRMPVIGRLLRWLGRRLP
jgi:hypothetical protein